MAIAALLHQPEDESTHRMLEEGYVLNDETLDILVEVPRSPMLRPAPTSLRPAA